ncbi:hypothetical protein BH24ACT15_BH24ACT15_37380 [soil metagenome]
MVAGWHPDGLPRGVTTRRPGAALHDCRSGGNAETYPRDARGRALPRVDGMPHEPGAVLAEQGDVELVDRVGVGAPGTRIRSHATARVSTLADYVRVRDEE